MATGPVGGANRRARRFNRGGAVMARLDSIAPRLRKLLLMLSSDRDGEVIAAARLIGTTLKNAGGDWHDLATELLTPTSKKPPPPPTPPHEDDDADDWRAMRAFCLGHAYLLRSR